MPTFFGASVLGAGTAEFQELLLVLLTCSFSSDSRERGRRICRSGEESSEP